MDRDALYLRRVDALEQVVKQKPDEYALLLASADLRQLLLDADPLANQVNRGRRVTVRFRANPEGENPMLALGGVVLWAWHDAIAPRLWAAPWGMQPEELTRDAFLAKRAAVVRGRDVTVKDVILQAAHVSGGVHAGTPKSEVERQISEISEFYQVGGMAPLTLTLRGIADIVTAGLEPLTNRIRQERPV